MTSVPILVASPDHAFADAVRDILAVQMPAASCERLETGNLRARPNGAVVVIDGRSAPDQRDSIARRIRAMGFAGGIVQAGAGPVEHSAEMGIADVSPDRLAHELVPAIVAVMERSGAPLADGVMRARRLVAAGETALHLQHDINNPLAGLLAELQLMEMDELSPEHADAVQRMLALCRRLMALTRSLDGMGERKS